MQFRRISVLGAIVFVLIVTTSSDAYGHGCQSQSCMYWPSGVLGAYSDVLSIGSLIAGMLIVVMLFFKFCYLRRKEFFRVKYSPTTDRINRILFTGRDKRKIVAALPFLVFGCYIVALGIWSMLTYGNLRTSDVAIAIAIISLPFFGVAAFLLLFGSKNISFVTLKKEVANH